MSRRTSRPCSSRMSISTMSGALFYASRGTIEGAAAFSYVPEERLHFIAAGETFQAEESSEEIIVKAFSLSHDAAEPIGYAIEADGEKMAIVTDTGIITDEIYEAVRDADLLAFESNHDTDMLMFGEYPYSVKVRIKGDKGHLSNDLAAETLSRLLTDRKDDPAVGAS